MGSRVAGAIFLGWVGCCACSPAAARQGSDAGTVPVVLEAPANAAPSPFTVAGSGIAPDGSKFQAVVAARAWETRVYASPSASSRVLGYLRVGATVQAGEQGFSGDGCRGSFRAVAPVGYVCIESGNATLDADAPIVHALNRGPDLSERLPYMYGIARRNGPIYARLPSRAEAEANEPGLDDRMKAWLTDPTDDGAAFRPEYWLRGRPEVRAAADGPKGALGEAAPPALALWEAQATREVPDWIDRRFPPVVSPLRHGEDLVVGTTKNHNGFALIDTAVVEGRRYGITTDLLVFPVDRLRPIEGSAFHGYRIPDDVDFPFALVRREGAAAYIVRKGKLVRAHDVPRRAAIHLTGKQKFFEGVLHFQTDEGTYLSDRYVARVDRMRHLPKWANEGGRWLDVSLAKQVLLAYDGTLPVYATLVSTGEAGLGDPETSKATVQGIFRIHTKHVTTTMNSEVVGEEFELKDIPYVQYFQDSYALHAAYWHDDFGIPHSHGCINLAPEDAKWLFQWTEPQLPKGWHGVRQANGSVVFIHP